MLEAEENLAGDRAVIDLRNSTFHYRPRKLTLIN